MAERFFATLKRELVDRPDREAWPDRAAARRALFDYLEVFYNRRRRHSALRYLSPAAYEAAHRATPAAAVA
jgi:transposase InsO family protein